MFGKTNMDLSIIIVTFNSEGTIKDCIDSILSTVKKVKFEIIVSDNSLNSETEETLMTYGDKISYIKNNDNLGFSKANNVAVKKAKGEYVLFLNPDTKVYIGTIDGMMDFVNDHPGCGVATCFVELPSGVLDDSSHRGFPTPLRSFSHFSGLSKLFPKNKTFGGYNLSFLDLKTSHEIESAAGSFMLVPKKVGDEIGWWDEDFFFYGEDIDFCYRVKEKGYSVWFVPDYKALHMKGISSGIKKVSQGVTTASAQTRKLATHHRFRAMEIFYDKHYKKKYPKYISFLVKTGIKLKKSIS